MEKFLEKFGLYDVFSMLIPGIFFMSLSLYLFPFLMTGNIESYSGISKTFLFFVLSYFSGVVFHELWRIWNGIIGKISKKKDIREKYAMEEAKKVRNELDVQLAQSVKASVLQAAKLDGKGTENSQNKFVFNYCMNVLEMEGMAGKEEKMQVISEMSASLFLSSLFLEFAYIISLCMGKVTADIKNILILLICIVVFYVRKNRYARYRVDNLLRTYYILMKKKENEKS